MSIRMTFLLSWPRVYKRRLLMVADAILISACLLMAVLLLFESFTPLAEPRFWLLILLVVSSSLLCFRWLGVYRLVIRYMNHQTILTLTVAAIVSALLVTMGNLATGQDLPVLIGVIHAPLLLLSVGGLRFALREWYLISQRRRRRPVVIYGAGAAGSELANALRHGNEYEPVAFVDDWRGLDGALVEGLRVFRPVALPALIAERHIAMVLLAIPSAPRHRRREILKRLSALSVPVQTIPGSADVISGRARISELRDVALEDLLGREPVAPDLQLMEANIRGKTVMVTGAGGSIGSELCRQILTQRPARLLLVDNCEFALYAIEQELVRRLEGDSLWVEIKPLLTSVQQPDLLKAVFDTFTIHTIYHAAAYKHVPMVEYNLVQGVRNNVFGTFHLAWLAAMSGVETFVMVSTDKAVRPTNVMGASKRITELICQALANDGVGATRFSMVRFGNVLGSSGSVVPLFRHQIEQGGPVEVTHPEITRYFMTIPEAAQLVIQAGAMAKGGEVFVLDMGEPVRIRDLAINMIRLSGLEVRDEAHPHGDIEIVYTGLRPGEKLYEELLIGEEVVRTRHPRIMTSQEGFLEWSRLQSFLAELDKALGAGDVPGIRQLLLEAPLGYRPSGDIADLVWRERSACLTNENPRPIPLSVEFDSAMKGG